MDNYTVALIIICIIVISGLCFCGNKLNIFVPILTIVILLGVEYFIYNRPMDYSTTKIGSGSDKYDEVSVGVVPISLDGTKVLITQAKSGPYGFAKGHMNDGESEKQGAVRENKEEIGIDISVEDLRDRITMEYTFMVTKDMLVKHLAKMKARGEKPHVNKAGPSKRLLAFYIARIPENPPQPDMDEVLDCKWVTWDEAEEYMLGKKGHKESNQLQILLSAKSLI